MGTRRWAYRKSALFTTVHSGARRTSEPETNLSLSCRKFVASSVLFHTYKYGETRVRTKFRFVSQKEIKSRPGKWSIQDSPWKTCCSQIWDPEPRISSRVWQKKCPGIDLLSLSEERLILLLQVMKNSDETNNFFKNNYLNKIGLFVKFVSGIWEEWKDCLKVTC